MRGKQLAILCLVSVAMMGLWTAPATAGWIDSVNGYDDGTTLWEGTSPYSSGSLTGYIEWAVFGPGEFPFSGYTPAPGQFTYVYQIVNTGDAAVSYWGVGLDYEASLIDWFASSDPLVDGVAPSSCQITGYSGEWNFTSLGGGTTSTGLVFSSPNKPTFYYGLIIDSGESCFIDDISSAGPEAIPEPTTIWLVASGLCMALAYWWRRR